MIPSSDATGAGTWRLATPAGGSGALALIALRGPVARDPTIVGIPNVPLGAIRLVNLWGVDRGIAARWTPEEVTLLPHGGPGVLEALAAALLERGVSPSTQPPHSGEYREASDVLEARMLAALSCAASPLAIDLLLDQPRRWREAGSPDGAAHRSDPDHDRARRHLLHPPLIVVVGASNIGKSTLANALAGTGVSLVADEAGTTRDHVGVTLDLGGLVVRWLDTPGVRETLDPVEREAADVAARVAIQADLIVRCGDARHPPVPVDAAPGARAGAALVVALRVDRGAPGFEADVWTAAGANPPIGLAALAEAVRTRLVPPAALRDPGPWRFWDD